MLGKNITKKLWFIGELPVIPSSMVCQLEPLQFIVFIYRFLSAMYTLHYSKQYNSLTHFYKSSWYSESNLQNVINSCICLHFVPAGELLRDCHLRPTTADKRHGSSSLQNFGEPLGISLTSSWGCCLRPVLPVNKDKKYNNYYWDFNYFQVYEQFGWLKLLCDTVW